MSKMCNNFSNDREIRRGGEGGGGGGREEKKRGEGGGGGEEGGKGGNRIAIAMVGEICCLLFLFNFFFLWRWSADFIFSIVFN